MPLQFDTTRDACMRLDKTIVFWEGLPFYCSIKDGDLGVRTKKQVHIARIDKIGRNTDWKKVNYDDERFGVGFPELGYCNVSRENAYYCSSMPQRSQRWGISRNSVNAFYRGRLINRLGDTSMLSKAFYDTIVDNYPSIQECNERVRSGRSVARAFDREFCIMSNDGHDPDVYFGTDTKIGTIDAENRITLDRTVEGYEYTRKILSHIAYQKGGEIV